MIFQECSYCKWRRETADDVIVANVTDAFYKQMEFILYDCDSLDVRAEVHRIKITCKAFLILIHSASE